MNLLLLWLLALGGAVLATPPSPPSLAATLKASQWKKRVLLVAAPTAAQADFQAQKQLLATAAEQLTDRDMLVLDVLADRLAPADRHYLQTELQLSLSSFAVVLIGKDGGVKQRSTRPLMPGALFGTIDKMPMRRQEMRQRP